MTLLNITLESQKHDKILTNRGMVLVRAMLQGERVFKSCRFSQKLFF
jgi:hypothetical protein